ncbi:hypothetical protein HDU91_003543 [Kappamyces sp. JEL0680]|nr:hypothetical protein HDU91_003543 [Kappamyces sp. JEL0680]
MEAKTSTKCGLSRTQSTIELELSSGGATASQILSAISANGSSTTATSSRSFLFSNSDPQDADDEGEEFLFSTDHETRTLTFNSKEPKRKSLRSYSSHQKLPKFYAKKPLLVNRVETSQRLEYGTFQKTPVPPAGSSQTQPPHEPTIVFSSFLLPPELHEHFRVRKPIYRSTRCLLSCIMLSFVLLCVSLIGFSFQPLSNAGAVGLSIKTRSALLFEFDVLIQATNANFIPVTLLDADLDVFASHGVSEPHPVRDGLAGKQELLGHVRTFNASVSVSPTTYSVVRPRVTLVDPNNTLGKFIYLTLPFTLTIRGEIWYTSPFSLVHYTIPVCLYAHVDEDRSGKEVVESHICL